MNLCNLNKVKFSNWILFILLVVSVISPLDQSSTALAQGKTVGKLKIGVILPLSGKMALYGKELKGGFEVGLSEYFKKNKISPKAFQIYYEDNKGSNNESEKIALKLLKKNRVHILLGGISTPESSALASLAQKYKRIYFSLLSKEIDSLSKRPTSFMLSSSYRWQAEIAAEYVAKYARTRVAAVISPEDAPPKTNLMISTFSKSLIKKSTSRVLRLSLESENTLIEREKAKLEQEKAVKLSDGEATEEEQQVSETGESDESDESKAPEEEEIKIDPRERFIKLANEIKNSRAEIVFFPLNWAMSEPIIKELELLGYKGKILGLEYWESTLAYKKLYNLRYMTAFHVTHYRPDILPSSFMGDFKSKFYRIPSALAAIGYDASRTIGSIYSSAKSVRTTPLLDSIKKSKNINGILSRLRMGWDKSMERAMSVSSPRAGGANTGILIVPNGLSLAAGKKKSR